MPATRLERRAVAKVWGRRDVPPHFGPPPAGDEPLGEVWFPDDARDDAELLIKYLFTSEKLSIQVHPGDEAALAAGHRRGKDEAWVVLSAEPAAVIGLGLIEPVSRAALRDAALDGSIEQLIDWRPVEAGDTFYSPAGTVHALGPGLTVVEIQQNLDLTYRLYDYGRPRGLQVDQGVAAATPEPYRRRFAPEMIGPGRELLCAGAFVVERWRGHAQGIGTDGDAPVWLVPLDDGAAVDGRAMDPGHVWVARGPTEVQAPDQGDLLIAYSGSETRFRD
jgi:mannose-6-phosphate isomerase